MIFDTHAHYYDNRFEKDRDELFKTMRQRGIGWIVNIAAEDYSLEACKKLSDEYENIYYTAGIHPSEIGCMSDAFIDKIKEYAKGDKCLAIGEIGLDYYHTKEADRRKDQADWFVRQLELARELDLPVVIHSRDAAKDTMDILKQHAKDLVCDIHCFSYSPEIALEYVKMGFYIGIGGVVTYKNAKNIVETVRQIPIGSILLETDCPYLTPEPFRGTRNDSTYLPYVVKRIAQIKELTEDEVIEVTTENAKKFYHI